MPDILIMRSYSSGIAHISAETTYGRYFIHEHLKPNHEGNFVVPNDLAQDLADELNSLDERIIVEVK